MPEVVFHTSVSARMQGLLFKEPDTATHVLVPCSDVHTFGMHQPLDIAFVDSLGTVLASFRNVPSRKRLRHKQAQLVLERFSSKEKWYSQGDTITLGVTHG